MVAPFEADAQLAFLSLEGFADVVISEDSDLLVFGCKQVFGFQYCTSILMQANYSWWQNKGASIKCMYVCMF